ncbi:SDR family oxidoreductase [Actinocatenispora sera]|nr:SDR family oxidoreductase [Actinocatenispora sera]
MSFEGQRILVMGGSSGIGAATARRFAHRHATVTVTGRDPERLHAIESSTGARAVAVDATDKAALAGFFGEDTTYDHLVLALSEAAGAGPISTMDLDEIAAGFAGKFWPQLRTLQAALPRLAASGSVTFITAVSARIAMPGTAGLAAINGALESMIPPLAAELAPLRINAVSPGVIDTPWWSSMPEDARAEMFQRYGRALPAGRVGTADEVAQAVEFLAGNGYMTGSVIECAGGAQLASL